MCLPSQVLPIRTRHSYIIIQPRVINQTRAKYRKCPTRRMATLKNAFAKTKAGYYRPWISPIDTTLPIKNGGVPFRLGFFQQTVFQAAGVHPSFLPNPPVAVQKNQ